MKKPGKVRHFKESKISLVMQGEIAHGKLKDNVRKLMVANESRETIIKQCKWQHDCVFDWVDWDSMEIAVKKMKKMSCYRWLRMTKFMNDTLHANVWVESFCGEESKCVDCGEVEWQEHIFRCAHEQRKQQSAKTGFQGSAH